MTASAVVHRALLRRVLSRLLSTAKALDSERNSDRPLADLRAAEAAYNEAVAEAKAALTTTRKGGAKREPLPPGTYEATIDCVSIDGSTIKLSLGKIKDTNEDA